MCWTDRPRRGALAAGLAALTLAGCAGDVGTLPGQQSFGEATRVNLALQAGLAIDAAQLRALAEDFAAAAPDTVTFDFDSARPDATADAVLAAQARWLQANPGALMRLEGHADLVGAEAYNDRLGLRRAQAVASRLAALGVAPARLRAVESRGFRDPVVPTPDPERRNRRVVTLVEGYGVRADGPGMDGKRAALAYDAYSTRRTEAVTLDVLSQ